MGSTGTTPTTSSTVKINPPPEYDGNKRNFNQFWQRVHLFIDGNPSQFTTEQTKIVFVLSYLAKGDAATWAESFVTAKMDEAQRNNKTGIDYGTWAAFSQEFQGAFKSQNAQKDALHDLNTLRMKNNSAEDHVALFKTLVTRSGLKEETDIIRKFEVSLADHIRERINLGDEPKDLKDWYEKAVQTDNRFRRLKEDIGQNANTFKYTRDVQANYRPNRQYYTPRPQNNYRQERDPNAMDIDVLKADERTTLMKKGACFNCKETGHLARDCPKPRSNRPQGNPNYRGNNYNPNYRYGNNNRPNYMNQNAPPPNRKNLTQQVRSMSKEEKREFYLAAFGPDTNEEAEEEDQGF